MICKLKSTKLNGSKYCYVLLMIQFNISHLNDQTVLFQTIQFSISHLFAQSLNAKQFYLTHRIDLRVMAMKGYFTWLKAPALPSDCLMSHRTLGSGGFLPLCRDAVGVFYSPSWLGHLFLGANSNKHFNYRKKEKKRDMICRHISMHTNNQTQEPKIWLKVL